MFDENLKYFRECTFDGIFSTVHTTANGMTPADATKIIKHKQSTGIQSNDDKSKPIWPKYAYKAKENNPIAAANNETNTKNFRPK